jgi:hypothetical protein
MTTELNYALEYLTQNDHKVGQAYIDESGHLFVIVDEIAMKPGDAIRIAREAGFNKK